MESISIVYTHALTISHNNSLTYTGEGIVFYHKKLKYTDSEGRVHVFDAGHDYDPDTWMLERPLGLTGADKDRHFDSEADFIKKMKYSPPTEVLVTGADLSGHWASIEAKLTEIGNSGILYNPLGTNSNYAADLALLHAGLPLPEKDLHEYFCPGSINTLLELPNENIYPIGDLAGNPDMDPFNIPLTNFINIFAKLYHEILEPIGDLFGFSALGKLMVDIFYATPPENLDELLLPPWEIARRSKQGTASPYTYQHFNIAKAVRPPSVDPLVLDLDGDGFEIVGQNEGITFDHNDNGVAQGTNWVKPDDGLLVFDRNGDGVINNGRELFGEYTPRYDGLPTPDSWYSQGWPPSVEAPPPWTAFDALAQEDTNGDDVVNHLDANWSSLKSCQSILFIL